MTTAPLEVLTVGEALVCLTALPGRLPASSTLTKSIGGAESNVAIALARLGRSVGFASRLGRDPMGDEIVRTLRAEGVDVAGVVRSRQRPTGLMIKEPRTPDDVRVYYYRDTAAVTELAAADIAPHLERSHHLHVSGITLALSPAARSTVEELLGSASARGMTISFDPNLRSKLGSVREQARVLTPLLSHVDHLLLSEAEARLILQADHELSDDSMLKQLHDLGPRHVVLRRGEAGAVGARRDGPLVTVPALQVSSTVDTVGAGDAFTAGYLHEMIDHDDMEVAMTTGAWVAGHVVTHPGDYEGAPYKDDYEHWRGGRAGGQR
jgi:sugar/nucleoside kinase (ribokinase family)